MSDIKHNDVLIRGVIERKLRKNDSWCMTVIRTDPEKGREDKPAVFWYGDMIDIVDDAFHTGDHVTISARITTSKKHQSQTLIGLDINDTPHELDEKFQVGNVGKFKDDANEVNLYGTLEHVFQPKSSGGKLLIATMRVEEDGYVNLPNVVFFGEQIPEVKSMKKGDQMCVVGHIQTRSEFKDGKFVRYQSCVSDFVWKIKKKKKTDQTDPESMTHRLSP